MTHLTLSLQLLRQYGAQLAVIWLAGHLLGAIVMDLAVEAGLVSRVAGLAALFLVILLQLIVFVSMFIVLRDGLPEFRRRNRPAPAPEETGRESNLLVPALLAALVPFYGYYAGWGFLMDMVRDYSARFMEAQWARVDFSDPSSVGPPALEVGNSLWTVLVVVVIWGIRRFAKARSKSSGNRFWPLVIVASEATWVLMALFALSDWKGDIVTWLASLPTPGQVLDWLIPAAQATISSAETVPVDWPPALEPRQWLIGLFWYALLPLIWFNLGAIVYGHDLAIAAAPTRRMTGKLKNRWQRMPKFASGFVEAYWGMWFGLAKRWNAVMNGVMLAASAGFVTITSVIVLWRLADWLGRWAWLGLAELIGPQDSTLWHILQWPLNILFGMPGQPQEGVLVVVVQFCLLAAGLELSQRARKGVRTPAA